jgi:hypothetical protein
MDEVVESGNIKLDAFSKAIIFMLRRWNLEWSSLTTAYADNPVFTKGGNISKTSLENEICKYLGKKAIYPQILSVKEGDGSSSKKVSSVYSRTSWLYAEMVEQNYFICDVCKWSIESLQKWEYDDKTSEYKDILDALMYAYKTEWSNKGRKTSAFNLIV